MNRISSSARCCSGSNGAEVGVEERRAAVGVELVVDREVREVEEDVAHARVLPVDDPDAPAVVDEVRVEEVVVTRALRRGAAQLLDAPGELPRPGVRRRTSAPRSNAVVR